MTESKEGRGAFCEGLPEMVFVCVGCLAGGVPEPFCASRCFDTASLFLLAQQKIPDQTMVGVASCRNHVFMLSLIKLCSSCVY